MAIFATWNRFPVAFFFLPLEGQSSRIQLLSPISYTVTNKIVSTSTKAIYIHCKARTEAAYELAFRFIHTDCFVIYTLHNLNSRHEVHKYNIYIKKRIHRIGLQYYDNYVDYWA